jgi:hypothetical protein
MSEAEIRIYVNRRREIVSAAIFALPAAIGIEGLATDTRTSAAIILLLVFLPLALLAVRRAARRGPVLILTTDAVEDPVRGLVLRWESITEARVTEIRGAFTNYHQLHLTGSEPARAPSQHDEQAAIEIAVLERLSMPWTRLLAEIQRRLPERILVHHAQRVTAKRTTFDSSPL